MTVLNKSADKLKGCAAKPRTLSPARCARGRRDKLTPPRNAEHVKKRGRARKRPLNRFGVFRAFSPALYVLYFFRYFLGRAFFRSLSRRFTCGTFVFQVSLFLCPFSNSLQNTVSKILTISLLLTTGNDFCPFLNGKICRCFLYSFGFPVFLADILYHIFSNSVRTLTDTFPPQKVHRTATLAHCFFPPYSPSPQIAFSGGLG